MLIQNGFADSRPFGDLVHTSRVVAVVDKDIAGHLNQEQIDRAFSLDTYLRNIDAIFQRVFQSEPPAVAGG